jgi:hypothetical protein
VRIQIPGKIMDEVRIFSGDRCCICQHRGQHIHHLNEINSDHTLNNLALLCFNCHDRATRGPGLGHGLNARTIRAFREVWYKLVEERRARYARRPRQSATPKALAYETALMLYDVRKLRWAIARDDDEWDRIATHLDALWEYAREGETEVHKEILEAVDEAISNTRFGMHFRAASKAGNVLLEILPMPRKRRPGVPPASRENKENLDRVVGMLWNLGYDAILYRHNLAITDVALGLMKWIYRYAELNAAQQLLQTTKEKFLDLIAVARRAEWPEAQQLVEHEYTNAPKVATGLELPPPGNLDQLIRNHRALPPKRKSES